MTVGQPGDQGDTVKGMQGIGVRTPNAAAVAEATVGFEGLVHMPNGTMFVMGWKSMMVAAGWLLVMTRCAGITIMEEGAMPKLHCSVAPLQTC